MKQTIKEAALEYMERGECNFNAADRKVTLKVWGHELGVESIWHGEDDDKVYLHCGCQEFEADIDIETLSDTNQQTMQYVFDKRREESERLLQETIVLLSADLYQAIYQRDECGGWGDACDDIIRYAKQFERELKWREDDDRDYLEELEKFEHKVLDELNKK